MKLLKKSTSVLLFMGLIVSYKEAALAATYGAKSNAPSTDTSFNESCYLARYPDVVTYWINKGGRAIDHWNQHGKSEGRIPGCDAATPSVSGPYSISNNVFGAQLVISTSQQFAGAIDSVTWNGQQFINKDDHGRQLQSASSFDGLGECFNPTEAGSSKDGSQKTSTSKLLGITTSGNKLSTQSQMAFWTQANEPYPSGCGGQKTYTVAQNKTNLSTHIFSKQVTIGFEGIENAVEYLVSFKTSEAHSSATFEFLTGYMPKNFSSFWSYDPRNFKLTQLSHTMGEQTVPVILSTADQRFAMGIYSPDLPQQTYPNAGYGRFDFAQSNTMKWNAVYRYGYTPAGIYSFRSYVIIGNLLQVQQGMSAVHKYFYPDSAPTVEPLLSLNVFDVAWYLANNGDLRALNFSQAKATQHWLEFGIREGRKGNQKFNSRAYLNRYPDLQKAFGATNYLEATKHFLEYGMAEGRIGGD